MIYPIRKLQLVRAYETSDGKQYFNRVFALSSQAKKFGNLRIKPVFIKVEFMRGAA